MPPPKGAKSGVVGQGRPLRLFIVGDSSAEGVGVSHQKAALSGRTVDRLARDFEVHWRVVAKSGATAGDTVERLKSSEAETFDVAITVLGVNDTKNGIGSAAWQAHYQEVFALLQEKFEVRHILACGLPPLQDFPLLPNPLRGVLDRRARRFEALLLRMIAANERAAFLPMPPRLDPSKMAEDGFHPGPEIYDEWGARAAAAIEAMLR
ncbi:SGNH/GDSL hydrolase family protein [Roseovarius sp. EL26]|uniref:SGNH/GDSL hydrolase family protein n=1 Tax=Roseovarius sp. EL26 TaxID=2126672 RepID=UPI0013C4FB30|nr:SGNH/GDSL hydrolase family protein [Roseovarius sp. EL26]